jgi:hypothetical protein
VDRLFSLCRGKYTKKLAELRKRHDTSLSVDVDCFEISANREWIVQSSSDVEKFYNVTRADKLCNSCDLRCADCSACIHDFLCTCPDMCNRYNMCKHIHYVCRRYLRNEVMDFGTSSEEQMLVNDENERRMLEQVEVNAHIAQLLRFLHVDTDLSVNREIATRLSMDATLLIKSATDYDQLLSIIDSLCSIRPCMEAISASRNETALMPINPREPANKNLQPQRRLVKRKKERAKKGPFPRESNVFKKTFHQPSVGTQHNHCR